MLCIACAQEHFKILSWLQHFNPPTRQKTLKNNNKNTPILIIVTNVIEVYCVSGGVRCSSVVRAFANGAMGCQIDPTWSGPIELFLVPASAPRLE